MKTTASLFSFLLMMIIGTYATAQAPVIKSQKESIKTSAVCGMCKNTIETALFKVKGVKAANLTVATKMVEVTFDPRKTNLEAIRGAISKAGYDADDLAADPVAYDNLHACCKKDSHD